MYLIHFIECERGQEKKEFDRVARISKASQFIDWLTTHVLSGYKEMAKKPHEISRDQLEQLLEVCNHTRRYAIRFLYKDQLGKFHYHVDQAVARAILPIREHENGELFFPYAYDDNYASQIIQGIQILNSILTTTNFEKQAIYFFCE